MQTPTTNLKVGRVSLSGLSPAQANEADMLALGREVLSLLAEGCNIVVVGRPGDLPR